jgi:cobalamin synthase
VRLPRNVSPAAARRRSLLVDAILGILVGVVAISVAAGIGVVGFVALICALIVVSWYLIEGSIRMARRKSRG